MSEDNQRGQREEVKNSKYLRASYLEAPLHVHHQIKIGEGPKQQAVGVETIFHWVFVLHLSVTNSILSSDFHGREVCLTTIKW